MNELKRFFEEERKRVFEPDAFFTQRVMARLDEQNAQNAGLWEAVARSTRPVLALALMLMLCFILAEAFVPQVPQRGMIESFLAPVQSPTESFLYSESGVPSRQILLQELIEPEEQ